jgi:predicted kinase
MADGRPFVVVTGLAGAGKSTLAVPLAAALDIPLISKDGIKEALLDVVGSGDWQWSKTLSRGADAAMIEIARDLPAAVLDNYWYPETAPRLLSPFGGRLVEVCCRVDPDVARARFTARRRHPGHADVDNPAAPIDPTRFPLRTLGPVVEVDTTARVDARVVAAEVVAAATMLALE